MYLYMSISSKQCVAEADRNCHQGIWQYMLEMTRHIKTFSLQPYIFETAND